MATVKKFYDAEQASAHIRSYHPDITVDMMRQSGLFSYYNSLLVQADAQLDLIDLAISRKSTQVEQTYRMRMAASGTKYTEAMVKSHLAGDDDIFKLERARIEAKAEVGYLKGTCEALRQKKDMVMQIGMGMRAELKGSDTIMGTANKENRNERLKALTLKDDFIDLNVYE